LLSTGTIDDDPDPGADDKVVGKILGYFMKRQRQIRRTSQS